MLRSRLISLYFRWNEYIVTGMAPHSSGTGGGHGGGETAAPANVNPIFIPSDLVNICGLLLSLGAGMQLQYNKPSTI